MRTLILLAVILHLAIIITEINGYKFGDIISFKRTCTCLPVPVFYKHFAVYVDKKGLPGQGDNDIFHRTGKPTGADCVFDKLKEGSQEDNYLENTLHLEKASDEVIEKHITEMIQNGGNYNVANNNCEHLATYVRYGVQRSEQHGANAHARPLAWLFCKKEPCPALDDKMKKALKDMEENAKLEEKCFKCSDSVG